MRPYRKERVASEVRTIVCQVIAQDLNDPRVAPLTTVTRVEVTGDLLQATVFVTIPGDEAAENRTMAALRHARGYVQGIVARSLNLRQCPELRFRVDESWKEARRTLELIEENRRNRSPDEKGTPPDEKEDANADLEGESESCDLDPSYERETP